MRSKIITLILFLYPFSSFANRDISSQIIPSRGAQIYAETKIQGILKEKNKEKRLGQFRDFYAEVQSQVKKYDESLTKLYKELEHLEGNQYLETKKVIDLQQDYLQSWSETSVALEKPAKLFLHTDKDSELTCTNISAEIANSYLLSAPEGSELPKLPRFAIQLSQSLCSK